jgi:hypothetical protein
MQKGERSRPDGLGESGLEPFSSGEPDSERGCKLSAAHFITCVRAASTNSHDRSQSRDVAGAPRIPARVRRTPRPFTLHEIDCIMGNIRALGISLTVAGLALVCGTLILRPRAAPTGEEEKTESRKEERTETLEMADLLRRLNEIPDDDPFK